MNKTLICCLSLCLLIACTKKADDTIKIGAAGPYTGDQAQFGADQLNAVKMAIDEWNAKGGVLGRKIELVQGDDQADPKQAVAVANKFVTQGVVAVQGHLNSSCSLPASAVYGKATIPMISHGTTNPSFTEQGFKNVFRVSGRDDQQSRVSADFVINVLKARRIVVLHDKTTYGQGLADEFAKAVGSGAQIVLSEGVVKGEKDYSPIATKVKVLEPDVIFWGGVYPEGGQLVKQYRSLGGKGIVVGGDGIATKDYVEIAGPAAEGTFATFIPDMKQSASAKSFFEDYQKKFGEPGIFSLYAYDATNIILTAIKNAGTTDGAKVSDAIHAIEYKGALGTVKFDAKGDVAGSPYVIWKVENGKLRQYK